MCACVRGWVVVDGRRVDEGVGQRGGLCESAACQCNCRAMRKRFARVLVLVASACFARLCVCVCVLD